MSVRICKPWGRVCKAIMIAKAAGKSFAHVELQNHDFDEIYELIHSPGFQDFGFCIFPDEPSTLLVVQWPKYDN